MKLQLPKLPKVTLKRPAFLTPKPKKPITLRAATASPRMKPGVDEYDEEEPQTRLSSAFFVVLILHVVAVGGIYAFNSIKEHRRGLEPRGEIAKAAVAEKPAAQPTAKPAAAAKTAAAEPAEAPAKPAASAAAAPVPPVVTAPVSGSRVYHVKPGDSLTKIAQQVGTTVVALQLANKDTGTLKPGQVLNIPARSAASAAATVEPPAPNPAPAKTETAAKAGSGNYVVKSGDTATSIARRHGVSVDELLKLNKISDPKKLPLGAALKIPAKKN